MHVFGRLQNTDRGRSRNPYKLDPVGSDKPPFTAWAATLTAFTGPIKPTSTRAKLLPLLLTSLFRDGDSYGSDRMDSISRGELGP